MDISEYYLNIINRDKGKHMIRMTEEQYEYLTADMPKKGRGFDAVKEFFVKGVDRTVLIEKYQISRNTFLHSVNRINELIEEKGWVTTPSYILPKDKAEELEGFAEDLMKETTNEVKKVRNHPMDLSP